MEGKEIRLYQAKGVLVILLIVMIVCSAGSGFATWFFIDNHSPLLFLIAAVLLDLCFVAGFILSIIRLLSKEPLMIINTDGISGRFLLPGGDVLSWTEIDKIFVYPFRFQKFIGIEVKDPESVLARLPEGKRRVINWGRNMGYPTFSISTGLFNMPTEDFVNVLENFRKEKKD